MKVICEKEKILKGITSVINGVASKTTMPILEGILIQTNDNELKLTSYDLEIGIDFGKRDHSTVMHAYKKIDKEIKEKNNTKLIVESVKNIILNIE